MRVGDPPWGVKISAKISLRLDLRIPSRRKLRKRMGHPPGARVGVGCVSLRLEPRYSPNLHHRVWALIDLHPSLFVIGVAAIAAPLPVLWFEQQSALRRIAMRVPQLLDALALAP